MLTVAKLDRYDMVNNPLDKTASFTIWFSGCSFCCDGCYNQQLQDSSFGSKYTPQQLSDIVLDSCHKLNTKTVAFIGGEPLQQNKEELLSLCRLLNEDGINIWIYTGYEFEDVDTDILDEIHTIKCGRFVKSLMQDGFPASSNQKIYRHDVQFGDDMWVDITNLLRRI